MMEEDQFLLYPSSESKKIMKVGDKLLIFKIPRKELSCSNPYLFTTRWCKPFLYFKLRLLNLTELIVLNDFGLQKYIWMRKYEFVATANTQYL